MNQTVAILIIGDKPSTLERTASAYRAVHGIAGPIHGITNGAMQQGFKFAYPRGRALSDYPLIQDPVWQYDPGKPMRCIRYDADGHRSLEGPYNAQDIARQARHIVLAGDDWPSDYASQETFLMHTFGPTWVRRVHEAVRVTSFDNDAMTLSIAEATRLPGHGARRDRDIVGFVELMKSMEKGKTQRLIEYLYMINAFAIYGQVLRSLSITANDWIISRWGIQLLYGMRHLPPLSEGELIREMAHWRSHAGERQRGGLGSPAWREQILDDLIQARLIAPLGPIAGQMGHRPGDLSLSELGRSFLSRLHPDTEDRDLRNRTNGWIATGLSARPQIERYYRTIFGKQMRFFKKHYQ